MPVVEKTVAPASRNIDVGDYGSRVALRLPGTTGMIRFSKSHTIIASEAKQSIARHSDTGLLRRFAPLRKRFAFVAGNDVKT
jgi:hypothetical protein